MNRLVFLLALTFGATSPVAAGQPERLPVPVKLPAGKGEEGKWGYKITRPDDTVVTVGKFDFAGPFSSDARLATVAEGERYWYIDPDLKPKFDQQFAFAGPFREGVARVRKEPTGKYAFIAPTGKAVTDFAFEDLGDLSGALARARREGKYGFVDKSGKWVIEARYQGAGDFAGGLAWVRKENRYGFIDKTGKEVVEARYEAAGSFSFGKAAVRTEGKFGYIDASGKQVIPAKFEEAFPFHTPGEGGAGTPSFAVVRLEGKYGVIDAKGEVVVKPTFETVAGPLELRTGNKVAVFAVAPNGQLVMKTVINNDFAEVKLESVPANAEVYAVDRYTFDGRPVESFLTWEFRTKAGNTDTAESLDKHTRWVLIFVSRPPGGAPKIETRNCRPAQDPTVKVVFP